MSYYDDLLTKIPNIKKILDNDKDLLVMAAVMHDGFKYGIERNKYTRFDHPLICSKIIMENAKKFILDINNLRKLCMMIESHMGKYNKDYHSDIVLPLPRNELERFLHRCIKFDNFKIVDFKEEKNEKK